MPALPFAQIDAFADRPFAGNPAAVVPLERWLDDAVLQAIAAENNLSETAFFVADASGEADFELRWFTPAVEVALCGHATLASGHYLLADGARERVTFRTRQSGVLEVARDGDGYAMALPAYAPEPAEVPGLLAALRVQGETFHHPRGYDLTVVESADIVRGLTPDFAALAALGNTLNIVTAPGDGGVDVVSRVFAPAVGLDEDPVTGSAHAVLAPYWAKRLGRDRFSAFQASARGGHLECAVEGARVVLKGRCVTVIEGKFLL
ncbi:PhzF family phenazine biosynthesis protein [Sphingomonas sp. IC-56]|uniref:PhzF family phenazine biosynthesis protein n=1 Tax=Sphingomonas sp. IC-56 TaxID=2898529 RepID=UPI001E39594A|nr:PhzF family phenazine biosynthesis protein [Sphingomonas sp. IC-56]MCD2323264.1 PhzF family phenazine biosynthesis protein [Sphingomonas sp. IC-56]